MATLFADTETFSETPITHGTHNYAEAAEVILIQWAVDDGPVETSDDVYDLPDPMSFDRVVFHNSHFDRHVLRHHGIMVPLLRLEDTMALALAHSLPGSLDKLCGLFGLGSDEAKIKDGRRLIQLFCKPRPKNMKLRRATRETHPEEWQRFIDYGVSDITAMRAIHRKLPRWNWTPEEREMWLLDQRINDAGVQIDVDLVEKAIQVCAEEKRRYAGDIERMTGGAVASVTQRDALLDYIRENFDAADLPDLQAKHIQAFLKDNAVSQDLVDILETREAAAKASVAKYPAIMRAVSSDGRLRNILQFCGAARTGRWSGKVIQPQNLPRPTMEGTEILNGIRAIKGGWSDITFDNRLELASNALRGVFIAGPGKQLVIADYSQIEGRVLAWLAGEEWKLRAFAAFDRKEGPDLYNSTAGKLLGKPPEAVTKHERQAIGKVAELASGYGGGVRAFMMFALSYGVELETLAEHAHRSFDTGPSTELWHWMRGKGRKTYGLEPRVWIGLDAIKTAWRAEHPATTDLWRDLESAFHAAIYTPGRDFKAGPWLSVRRDDKWVRILLPSGRSLCYPQAREENGGLSYWGIHQWTKQWVRIKTYGGKLAENVTQAVARDILVRGMLNVAPHFDIVMSVHDELITEAATGFCPDGVVEFLTDLMTDIPWAHGLPLAAAGFVSDRYRKDD